MLPPLVEAARGNEAAALRTVRTFERRGARDRFRARIDAAVSDLLVARPVRHQSPSRDDVLERAVSHARDRQHLAGCDVPASGKLIEAREVIHLGPRSRTRAVKRISSTHARILPAAVTVRKNTRHPRKMRAPRVPVMIRAIKREDRS